jgi:hypothetical protein
MEEKENHQAPHSLVCDRVIKVSELPRIIPLSGFELLPGRSATIIIAMKIRLLAVEIPKSDALVAGRLCEERDIDRSKVKREL